MTVKMLTQKSKEKENRMPRYKLTENNNIAVGEKGNPVIINDDGSEYELDAIGLTTKIGETNRESAGRKETIRELTGKLEKFAGIEDPSKALEALETIKTLSEKDLKNKEDLEALKLDMDEAYKLKMGDQEASFKDALSKKDLSVQNLESDLHKALVRTHFLNSTLFAGEDRKTILPADIAFEYFGKNWKVETNENGERVAIGYSNGKPVYSQERPGEIASFEEAMPKIIEASGQKIMKETTGSGSHGGQGTFRQKTVSGTSKEFINNIDGIASGKIKVETNAN